MTAFGGGDRALGRTERLFCCSKITVTALSADTFINHLLTYPFGEGFNHLVKISTKYTHKTSVH